MSTLGPFNTINAFWPEQVPSVSTVAQNLPAKLFFGVTLETKWSSSVTMKYEFSVGRDKSICFFSVLSGIVCSVALCCAAFTVLSRKLPRLEADSPPRASKAASIHWLFTVIQCGTAAALALCVCVCVSSHMRNLCYYKYSKWRFWYVHHPLIWLYFLLIMGFFGFKWFWTVQVFWVKTFLSHSPYLSVFPCVSTK